MKLVSTNPGHDYSVVGDYELPSPEEIDQIFTTAQEAQKSWAAMPLQERCQKVLSFSRMFKKYEKELANIVTKELGKPISVSSLDADDAINHFETYVELAPKALEDRTVFEDDLSTHIQKFAPHGVALCIAPWNFPISNVPFQSGQALIAGNSIIFKPSEELPGFSTLLQKIVDESDLPKGVFQSIVGEATTGQALVAQPVDAIFFTGSTNTGQSIIEEGARRSIPVFAEMGGSAPGVVFADADIKATAKWVASMRFSNSGQYCDGLKRLIVEESIVDEFVLELIKATKSIKVGNPIDSETEVGPLVSKKQLDLLLGQVDDAVSKGAKVLTGGQKPEGLEGAYFELTLLSNISFDMRVWKEEVFGPALPIVTFKTEEEAVELANDTQYGLGGFIYTGNTDKFNRIADQIQSGNIAMNGSNYFSPLTPFGGYKKSGNCRSQGMSGFLDATQIKVVSIPKI